jgi:hypothetical protein
MDNDQNKDGVVKEATDNTKVLVTKQNSDETNVFIQILLIQIHVNNVFCSSCVTVND